MSSLYVSDIDDWINTFCRHYASSIEYTDMNKYQDQAIIMTIT